MAKPTAIKEVIHGVIHNLTPTVKCGIAQAVSSALDKKTLQHIKIDRHTNNNLIIKVDSSVWLYVLNTQKEKLLESLNKKLPNIGICKIIFKIGRVS